MILTQPTKSQFFLKVSGYFIAFVLSGFIALLPGKFQQLPDSHFMTTVISTGFTFFNLLPHLPVWFVFLNCLFLMFSVVLLARKSPNFYTGFVISALAGGVIGYIFSIYFSQPVTIQELVTTRRIECIFSEDDRGDNIAVFQDKPGQTVLQKHLVQNTPWLVSNNALNPMILITENNRFLTVLSHSLTQLGCINPRLTAKHPIQLLLHRKSKQTIRIGHCMQSVLSHDLVKLNHCTHVYNSNKKVETLITDSYRFFTNELYDQVKTKFHSELLSPVSASSSDLIILDETHPDVAGFYTDDISRLTKQARFLSGLLGCLNQDGILVIYLNNFRTTDEMKQLGNRLYLTVSESGKSNLESSLMIITSDSGCLVMLNPGGWEMKDIAKFNWFVRHSNDYVCIVAPGMQEDSALMETIRTGDFSDSIERFSKDSLENRLWKMFWWGNITDSTITASENHRRSFGIFLITTVFFCILLMFL